MYRMEIGSEGLIILGTILCMAYFFYYNFMFDKLEPIKSSIDNREYLVQDRDDATDAANLIAEIRNRLITLVNHVIKMYPSDSTMSVLLKRNFNPDVIKEGAENGGSTTSYSINKGEQIILCLRNKDKLMDINTMMYVAIHELAHLANDTIGHDASFWNTFQELLQEAMNIGIYKYHDFDKEPIEYCSMVISSSIIKNKII